MKNRFYAVIFCLTGVTCYGQVDYDLVPEVTSTILINNVRLSPQLDSLSPLTDILIKDGYIVAIDDSITAPQISDIIEGDSAFVYPAFIDGLSNTGIKMPKKNQEERDIKFPGSPPDDIAGITPQSSALEFYDHNQSDIKNLREEGFAISQIVPEGKMLPGKGSIILLNNEEHKAVLEKDISSYFQFVGSRPYYPTTIIGIMAKWRELFQQTKDLNQSSLNKASNSEYDPVLEGLIPVVTGQQPIVMRAQSAKDIYRGLALKEDLGYKLIIADVQQAWDLIPKLESSNTAVLLSLELPEQMDKGKDDTDNETEDARIAHLKKRKQESIREYEAQAAKFEESGIDFGFSMNSCKAKDFRKNLLRMTEAGLSPEKAIEALTIGTAKILGIDHYTGTLAEGKLANLFLTDKDYFDKDSRIAMTMVKGRRYDFPKKHKSNGEDKIKSAGQISGEWSFEVRLGEESRTGKMIIKGSDVVEITVIPDNTTTSEFEAEDVVFTEGNVSFSVSITEEGVAFPVNMDLDFTADSFSGVVIVGGQGEFPISGSKISSPE